MIRPGSQSMFQFIPKVLAGKFFSNKPKVRKYADRGANILLAVLCVFTVGTSKLK